MRVNKLLRMLGYTVALVISVLIAADIFVEFYHCSGLANWIAVTLYQMFDDKTLRDFLEFVCFAICLIIAGFLYSAIFFRSGFSRWLKKTLLRKLPDPE